MPGDNFDDIAEFQGWSVATQAITLLDFISSKGLDKELVEYANAVADNENGLIINS